MAIALLLATAAHAHPHSWVDLRMTVEADEEGRITALRQYWLLDPMYSRIISGREPGFAERPDWGSTGGGGPSAATLGNAADEILDNLAEFDYFTRMEHGGEPVAIGEVSDHELVSAGHRLELSFTVELAEPVSPAEAPFRYAIFDPTYYIEVLHDEADIIDLRGGIADCYTEIEPPNPSRETIAQAAALDRDEEAGDDLGQHFAEWVTVRCD
jgi:ABC-type uncharacterized transport system substrate-binding protein